MKSVNFWESCFKKLKLDIFVYYATLLNLYSAIGRVKHESEHCDSAEPSYVA